MKSVRTILFTLMTVLAFANANAKIASWMISPKYDKLSRYTNQIFVFEKDGKYGLVYVGGHEVLPSKYDFILPFQGGYSIAGIVTNGRNLLTCIISENGGVVPVGDKYYITSTNQYFSEGKLAVADIRGKFGYIDNEGHLVISCKYDDALPFKEGWAPVKERRLYKYIHQNFSDNGRLLTINFNNGEVGKASCFVNGQAAVSYNEKRALLGINGNIIRRLSQAEFERIYKQNNSSPSIKEEYKVTTIYSEYSENSLYGLKNGNEIIVKPQFHSFSTQYSDGYIIANKNGKQGVLLISDGNYTFDIKATSGSKIELDVDRKNNIEDVNIGVTIPSTINNLKLMVDCGDGQIRNVTSQMSTNGTNVNALITPSPIANAENCRIKVMLENEGIIVAEATNDFILSYPVKLRLSKPGPEEIKANAQDKAYFSATVFNDSNKAVTVTATWSTGVKKTETKTIPAHGRDTFINFIKKVEYKHTRNIRISLDTGEQSSRDIYFEPFF